MAEEGKPAEEKRFRNYRPLDVHTWKEGWLITLGWILVPVFAIISVVLFYMYEMKYINISDRDVRDLYLDQRLMNTALNYNHKFFINGVMCCNPDPVVFGEPSTGCMPESVTTDYKNTWALTPPFCPPLIQIQCPISLTSTACNQTRAVLYPMLGMDPVTGVYTQCSLAGLLLVGAKQVAQGQPLLLSASYNGENIWTLALGTPINVTQVALLVAGLIEKYGSGAYVNPNVRLAKAFTLGGSPIPLAQQPNFIGQVGGKKTVKPWPFPIFNWPGAFKGRCPNTANREAWWLSGSMTIVVPPFSYSSPSSTIMSLTFLNDAIMINPWRMQLPSASDTVGNLNTDVSLQVIDTITIRVGMIREMGACFAWMIDESVWGTTITYKQVYKGGLEPFINQSYPGGFNQTISVSVFDTAMPMATTLPFYGGMWYIVMCFAGAAVWAFSLGPYLVFALPLLWWNIRSNRGLAPVVYRYMKKYRGW